jgi:hypothetical protein
MARALAALRPAPQPSSEPRLTVPNMFGLCAALAAARGCSAPVRATGRAGDVYLLHPLLVHAATVSRAGAAPRAVLNVPHPFPSARVAKKAGAFSAVTLPVRRALGARRLIPRAVLALLLRVAVVAARASLSALPRRRGWQALAAAVLEGVAALAFAAFDAAAAASLPRCGHVFSAREWAAANEYVRLEDDGRRGVVAVAAAVATAAADVGAAVRRWLAPSAKADGFEVGGEEEERTEYVAMLEQRPLLPRAAQAAAEP